MEKCHPSVYDPKYQQLLRDLKSTVEGLLASQVANVWNVYGGLNRLHNSLDKIFKHGCISADKEVKTSFFRFVQGLEWLQPDTSKSFFSIDCEYRSYMPTHFNGDKAAIWLYRSLESHSLSQKLSWLLSDKNHLLTCYQPHAFLCQEKYAEAALICLRAVERNQPSLLSEINPCLFLQTSTKVFNKVHRRCSSFPDNHMRKIFEEKLRTKSRTMLGFSSYKEKGHETKPVHPKKVISGKLKPWGSMPNLTINDLKYKASKSAQCRTTPSTPIYTKKDPKMSPQALTVEYNSLQMPKTKKSNLKNASLPKKPVKHVLIDNCDIIEHTAPLSTSTGSNSAATSEKFADYSIRSLPGEVSPPSAAHSPRSVMDYNFLPLAGEKDYKKKPKKSFIEDGGLSVLPMSTGFFPKPTKGQSLMSFLTSSHFARANAELDRENAHFSISEAIISAMEQIRCKRDMKLHDEQMDDTDPVIMDLKQRIRMRRRQKLLESHRKAWTTSMLLDDKTDTATSLSPRSTSSSSGTDSISSEEVDDMEIDEASNLTDNRGLSMSMASLYSDADIQKRPRGAPDGSSDILSAEGVALSLIRKFSEKQLPRASDLEWLVSEDDAPQALLPMPKSWPVSPDQSEDANVPLRGTLEWAPPRPQIIFTLHSAPSRKNLMAKQNYRCSGCSMRVDPQYAGRFRYCHYLGRYFCTGCHSNQTSVIPARIIHRWDFTRYPVSTFSYRLLEQMYNDPLFRVFELNKSIGTLSSSMMFCKRYRLGLFYLKDYILSCRLAEEIQSSLMELPCLFGDLEEYSLHDLVQIKTGEMKTKLKHLVDVCCKHTSSCSLCLGKGHICEICNSTEILFPWQMKKVTRCDKCGSCCHLVCWKKDQDVCRKCQRLNKWKNSIDNVK